MSTRYFLVEARDTGTGRVRADVTELDHETGADLSVTVENVVEWSMAAAFSMPLAVAGAIEELLR